MKKIGFDARLYHQTGIGVYIQNFIHYLLKKKLTNMFYLYFLPEEYESVKINHPRVIKKVVRSSLTMNIVQKEWLEDLYDDELDIMHFNFFIFPMDYKAPYVATIHDITHLISHMSTQSIRMSTANRYLIQIYYETMLKNAKTIFTPTNTVRKQICQQFGKKCNKSIREVPYGIDYRIIQNKTKQFDGIPHAGDKNSPFFIYVGDCFSHKNVDRLVRAFSKLPPKYKLYLLGPNSVDYKRLHNLIYKLHEEKRIIHISNPSYDELIWFYTHALALIHPSLCEGFGLPILEASYLGCPVIASRLEVFDELLDNHYLSFDPKNVTDIYHKILLCTKGVSKAVTSINTKKYSFPRMVDCILNEYNRINILL